MTCSAPHPSVLLCVLTGLWLVFCLTPRMPAAVQADSPLPEDQRVEVSQPPSPEDTAAPDEEGEKPKLIALTFDDGPKRSTTSALLDGLAERGAQATFFLIGAQLEGNEDLLLRMEAEGHEIGIHTYGHVQLTALSRADFDDQVERTRAILKRVLGHNGFLLRPPYGSLDESVRQWAGAPIILWSIDPEDWKDKDTARVVEHIVSHAEDGSIILLHDIYPESVEAALEVIDRLHAQGYYFVTVSDLFAENSVTLEPGEVYRQVEN